MTTRFDYKDTLFRDTEEPLRAFAGILMSLALSLLFWVGVAALVVIW